MNYLQRLTVICCLLTALITILHTPAPADITAKRVLLLPLTIHSEKDLTFLNQGIMDMLAARISQSATVIRKNELAPGKDPLQMGRDLDADFVVTGSLTIFGSSVSTDAALVAVESGETALQFSQFGQNSSDALVHINQFGTQAGQHLASLSATPQLAQPADAAPAVMIPQVAAPVKPVQPPPATTPQSAPAAAVTAAATAAAAASTKQGTPAAEPTPAAAETTDAPRDDEALWTSNPFKGTIRALATGDVNGDGRADIVFAHENQIIVEHRRGDRLERIAAVDGGKRHIVVAVDAGDINGNGLAEIFVTRLNTHKKLESLVLEWNGAALKALVDGQRWYFRVGNDPEGPILMGQRQGSPSANDTGGLYEDNHFLPGVVELTWTGKGYQAGRRVVLPSDMTVYRFAQGDVFNDGKTRTIAYSASDKLHIYDPAGSPQWAGRETLGGNPLFLESTSSTDVRTTDHTYLSQRLYIVDLDGDGKVEVVTVHNRDTARGLVERFRKYSRGKMIVLSWNKVNMKPVWTGEEIGGYISDFSLADINGDGRLEAVYAMVTSTGLAQTKSSNIVVEQIGSLSD